MQKNLKLIWSLHPSHSGCQIRQCSEQPFITEQRSSRLSQNISTVSTHKRNWEKNTWRFASLLVKASFRGVYFPQLLVFSHPHATALFLLIQLLHPALFHALFLLMHLWLSPLWITLPERKGFFSSGLYMYQCFAQRMWIFPLPMPKIQMLAPSFDLRNLFSFASFHLCLCVPIALRKRK